MVVMPRPPVARSVAVLTGVAALLAIYAVAVATTGFMPRCWFNALTGLQCPGCGSQRAFIALIHGHPLDAWRYNLIIPPALAYLALMAILPHGSRAARALTSPAAIWTILCVVIIWTIVRNILRGC